MMQLFDGTCLDFFLFEERVWEQWLSTNGDVHSALYLV